MKYLAVALSICTLAELSAAEGVAPSGKNFWCELDALFWQPFEKSAVVTNKYAPVLVTDDFTENKVSHPHFNWDWGFRIGVGYYFIPLKWSLDCQWTHFTSTASQTRSTNVNDAINPDQLKGSFPIWNLDEATIAGDYISDSHLHWKWSLNLLDLNFTRIYKLHRVCLKPFAGLRSGWIRQKFDIAYSGGIFAQTLIAPGLYINGVDTISMRNAYWGLGPRIGFAPSVLLGNGISFYGEAAISALMGIFHLDQEGEYLGTTQFHIHSHPFGLRWILDAAAGLSYCTPIFANRYDLSFKLGYEFHEFYHQMELRRDAFQVAPHDRNLSVQGVVANVRMDF